MNDSETERELGSLVADGEQLSIEELAGRTLPSGPVGDQAMNNAFSAISKPEQRYVLTYLLRSDGEITIASLVDYVIAETDITGSPEVFRERMTTQLTHSHLPALAEAGLIEYNMERQLIRRTELTPLVEPYLEIALAQLSLLAERASD